MIGATFVRIVRLSLPIKLGAPGWQGKAAAAWRGVRLAWPVCR